MTQKFITWLCKQEWAYKLSKRLIANRIIRGDSYLTPQYLIDRGWIEENGFYIEPNMKDRDRIYISFEPNIFRVWHSDKKTFIAAESSIEWFEIYYLIIHPDNGIYKLAGI
jgi:hypothetical protein